MGFLERVFSIEQRGFSSSDDFWFTPISEYSQSKAGVYVNRDTAMRCATVYACVRVLAGSISSLPIHLYRRTADGGRERARDHWAYKLMHDQTGPTTPARQWVETVMYHAALVGNHYSAIEWTNAGTASRLVPLAPQYVTPEVSATGQYSYKYCPPDGKEHTYSWPNVLHVPALVWDGIQGLSPISYARESIGLASAAEEFGSRFYANGTNVGTVYGLPEGSRLSQEQTDKLVEDLRAKHAGLSRAHQAIILPAGMTTTKVGIPPDDAQFLETRKFQAQEIARIFGVPLHMIGMEEKDTSWGSGIEAMSTGFVIYTLRPWLVRIEQILNMKLLNGADRENYYFEFLVDSLLRGDQKTRAEFYASAIQNMWMTPNEIRERENMNPVEWGDEPVKPENIFGKSQSAPTDDTPPPEQKSACECGHEHRAEPSGDYLDNPRLSIQRSFQRVIRDAMARVIRRERNDILRAAEKQARKRTRGETRDDSLARFIEDFYLAHEEFTREAIEPAFTALAEAIGAEAMREIQQEWEWTPERMTWLEEYIAAFANRHSNQSRAQLLQMLQELGADDTPVDALSQRFEEWETGLDDGRPRDDKIAARESVRLGQGFARMVFFSAGVASLVWVATGSETCPYCRSLAGRRVTSGEVFLTAGEDFQPSGAETPLRPSTDIGHPPCHAGCDCLLIPGG